MAIPYLNSVKTIEQQYQTGEEPVLVMCSDMSAYVCKYMRSSASAYKLVCELIGSQMAKAWKIETPDIAFVRIKQGHWSGRFVQHSISAPSFGSKRIESVVDVTPSTNSNIKSTIKIFRQLLKIALFDFWIANEDRNLNNANLLYDVSTDLLVSIDYGCILNTASFGYGMSQLTTNESILCSDLFHNLVRDKEIPNLEVVLQKLNNDYNKCLTRSKRQVKQILDEIPMEWHIPTNVVDEKLKQLFDTQWSLGAWTNFKECLIDNFNNE